MKYQLEMWLLYNAIFTMKLRILDTRNKLALKYIRKTKRKKERKKIYPLKLERKQNTTCENREKNVF